MENSLFFLTVSRSISVNCLPSSAVVSATLWKAKFLWNTSILVGGTICDATCTRFPRSAGKKNPVRHVSCSSFAMLRFSVLSGLVEKFDLGNLIKSQLGKWPKKTWQSFRLHFLRCLTKFDSNELFRCYLTQLAANQSIFQSSQFHIGCRAL